MICEICQLDKQKMVCADCFKELRQMVFRINKDMAHLSVQLAQTNKALALERELRAKHVWDNVGEEE